MKSYILIKNKGSNNVTRFNLSVKTTNEDFIKVARWHAFYLNVTKQNIKNLKR